MSPTRSLIDARALAIDALSNLEVTTARPVRLYSGEFGVPEHVDLGDAWLFNWNSVEHIRSGSPFDQILMGPLLVPKDGGDVVFLGTAGSTEERVEQWRRSRPRHGRPPGVEAGNSAGLGLDDVGSWIEAGAQISVTAHATLGGARVLVEAKNSDGTLRVVGSVAELDGRDKQPADSSYGYSREPWAVARASAAELQDVVIELRVRRAITRVEEIVGGMFAVRGADRFEVLDRTGHVLNGIPHVQLSRNDHSELISVPRSELTEIETVTSLARWHGLAVTVGHVSGGIAQIVAPNAARQRDDHAGIRRGVLHWDKAKRRWSGVVPVAELQPMWVVSVTGPLEPMAIAGMSARADGVHMPELEQDPDEERLLRALVDLGAHCRSTPVVKPGFVLWMSDGEVHDMITETDGYFVLLYASRSAAPQVLFGSDQLDDVARALVLRFGQDARQLNHVPPFPLPSRESELEPGCELADDVDGLRLSWSSGGRPRSAWLPNTRSGRIRAVEYSRVARVPVDALVRAFLAGIAHSQIETVEEGP